MEGEVDAAGQGAAVVADDVDEGADPLAAHAAQDAAARPVEPVGDLEEGDEGHDRGDEAHDAVVVAEQAAEDVLGGHERGEDGGAQRGAQHGGAVRGAAGLAGPPRAEQVAQARRGGDAEAEGHRVDDLVGRHDDALRGERDRAEAARGEGDDLEGPPLGADVHDAHEGEAAEGREVLQRAARGEAAPALAAADEDGVGDEQEEGEPIGEARGERGAVEADAEGVDEEVVQEGVQGRGDEEDVGARPVDLWGAVSVWG